MVLRHDPVNDLDATALPALRQSRLAALVRGRGQMTVGELLTRFGVSRDTIRRDLDALEQRGLLVRIHGGAIPTDNLVVREVSLTQRMDAQTDAMEHARDEFGGSKRHLAAQPA